MVGATMKDLEKWAKCSSLMRNALKQKNVIESLEFLFKQQGCFYRIFNAKKTIDILYLEEWKGDDNISGLLNHEIVHYRQELFSSREIKNESEFEAYFQQNTWLRLKRILDKRFL